MHSKTEPTLAVDFTLGACHRTVSVRPGLALRELLQRGVSEGFTARVDCLRSREIVGQSRPNCRDVLDNPSESDVTRSDVVSTSGLARTHAETV